MDSEEKLPLTVIGMTNEAYQLKREFFSRSYLHAVAEGGGEVQRWLDDGHSLFGGNASTRTGSQFDSLVMGVCEGKGLREQLCVPPDDVLGSNGTRNTKAYREWEAQQTGICVTADMAWQYEQMFDGLMSCAPARDLVEQTTQTQASVFFEHRGHKCKVRPDGWTPELWWDLKTTSMSWSQVAGSVAKFGYGDQEWLYTRGAYALGYMPFRMPFVFVSTNPPYRARVFYLPEDYVADCGRRMESVMEEVRLRRETGQYQPMEALEINELEIPNWARKGMEVVEL